MSFSFVLAGEGSFRVRDQAYRSHPPCVICQWPDEPVDYGPDKPGSYRWPPGLLQKLGR